MDVFEETGKSARLEEQGAELAFDSLRVVGHCGGALQSGPFRLEEVGREDRDKEFAIVDAFFKSNDEVVAPFNGFFVKEAGNSVAG